MMQERVVGGGGKKYDGKIAGLYDLEATLGRGTFAVVKLARHVFTGEKVAVKVIDKSKLDDVSRAHLFQEVSHSQLHYLLLLEAGPVSAG
jgi:serine/threonine protein kinase